MGRQVHTMHLINSLEELLSWAGVDKWETEEERVKHRRFWTIRWNRHAEKHGNVPMKMKCDVCSGKERKNDIKHGRFKPSQPDKALRKERKGEE